MKIAFDKNKIIGVGVSGGADSMVLLHLLLKGGAKVVAINVEHGIRGESSQRDTEFVKNKCRGLGVECLSFEVDVPAYAQSEGLSLETAARILRYEVFDKVLAEGKADVIALAHHADDLAETMLMRLARGTGVRGLRGIVDRAGYIHPLLGFTKREILDYATANGIDYVTDETNLDIEYNRNFIRNKVMPLLGERYPHFAESCVRSSEILAETEDFLLSEVTPYEERNGVCLLPIKAFDRHKAIAKKSVAECLRRGMGLQRDIEQRHLVAVLELSSMPNGTAIDLPFGVTALKENADVAFYKKAETINREYPVEVNKKYEFGGYCYQIVTKNELVPHVTFDIDKLPKGAIIRTRRVGDLFKKYGGGTKPLAEYFTDIKLPQYLRDVVPLIAEGSTVYAVMGIEIGDAIKVDKNTLNMVNILYNKLTKE